MYKKPRYLKSKIKSVDKLEGETIEQKVYRIVNNKEPVEDGAPEIFTEKGKGVQQAYNIRTDRFEVACEAMDKVHRSKIATRDNKGIEAKEKESTSTEGVVGDKSVDGKNE